MALRIERRGGHVGPVEPFRPSEPQLRPVPALRLIGLWLGQGRVLAGVRGSLFRRFESRSV
eukprot:8224351-Pyramimonas_sp.AAC.1